MPVTDGYIAYVLDQLGSLGNVFHKRMFGGVGLYHEDVFFGLIADDVLYFKVDDINTPSYRTRGSKPFQPYGTGGYTMSYYEVPASVLEDRDELQKWAAEAIAAALRKQSAGKPRRRPKRRPLP